MDKGCRIGSEADLAILCVRLKLEYPGGRTLS
jgi:hypothetical protein